MGQSGRVFLHNTPVGTSRSRLAHSSYSSTKPCQTKLVPRIRRTHYSRFFQEERGGLFIDIGCAWPLRGSTTCYLERKLGWSGIAVDALSEYAPGWATHRPRSKFLNYAVSDRSQEQLTFYRNEWTGVSSLSKQQSLKFGGEKKLTPIKVEAITINDLLKLNDITQVDHLTLDIERSELGALNGFDIQFYQPRLCCVENTTEEILAYFEKNNYQILEKYRKVDKINCYFSPR